MRPVGSTRSGPIPQVATRKWMERLLKVLKESREPQIASKVMGMLLEWERRFSSDQRFHEFSVAASKARHQQGM